MSTIWAQRPVMLVTMETASDRVLLAIEIARRAKLYADAVKASARASEQRGKLDAGCSRARITSANAKWSRAADDRDAKERNLIAALVAAGFKDGMPRAGGAGPLCPDCVHFGGRGDGNYDLECMGCNAWYPSLYEPKDGKSPLWTPDDQAGS